MAYDAFISYSHTADGELAPALQSGLQKLAKPWYRPRALRVFLDETVLSTNPHLWASITEALDDSEWFVLLASPEAATSEWVDRELEHWLATKPASRILPTVTHGDWHWDPTTNRLNGDAVPPRLADAITEEPRHLDLRWVNGATGLDLANSSFRSNVADLAAPIHGIAKDELVGEDLKQHRRARRLARTGIATVVILLIVSIIFSVFAVNQRDRAANGHDRGSTAVAREPVASVSRVGSPIRDAPGDRSRPPNAERRHPQCAAERGARRTAPAARFRRRRAPNGCARESIRSRAAPGSGHDPEPRRRGGMGLEDRTAPSVARRACSAMSTTDR